MSDVDDAASDQSVVFIKDAYQELSDLLNSAWMGLRLAFEYLSTMTGPILAGLEKTGRWLSGQLSSTIDEYLHLKPTVEVDRPKQDLLKHIGC